MSRGPDTYDQVIAELSRPRLHALGASFDPVNLSNDTFVYSFRRRWTVRITVTRFGDEGAVVDTHLRPSRGIALASILGSGWEHLHGPATIGAGCMHENARHFLVGLYEALRSRRDVQHDLARSKQWPTAA
jgi:hypothetical protein